MFGIFFLAPIQLPIETEATSQHLLKRMHFERKDQNAAARVTLWINSDGKVRSCDLVAYLGDEPIARQLCRNIVGARYRPARNASGVKLHSLLTTVLGASAGRNQKSGELIKVLSKPVLPSDYVVQLKGAPAGYPTGLRVKIKMLINQKGKAVGCERAAWSHPRWSTVACEQASVEQYEVRTSNKAQPVSYIRNLIVKVEGLEQGPKPVRIEPIPMELR